MSPNVLLYCMGLVALAAAWRAAWHSDRIKSPSWMKLTYLLAGLVLCFGAVAMFVLPFVMELR